jgi:hypothetical protein
MLAVRLIVAPIIKKMLSAVISRGRRVLVIIREIRQYYETISENIVRGPSRIYFVASLRSVEGDQETLREPVLIVQGTTDMPTRLVDARGLADGNPSQLLLMEGIHVLKTVPSERDRLTITTECLRSRFSGLARHILYVKSPSFR